LDVGGMIGSRMMGDAEVGEDHPTQNLDRNLFKGIGCGAEPPAEVAVEPMLCTCGMPILMRRNRRKCWVCGACYIIPDFSTTLREILSVAVQRDIDRRDIADLLDIPPAPVIEN
jgi:hypothetical protein